DRRAGGQGAVLNHADIDVAVFQRGGEEAALEGGAHRLPLALRHLALEHQALRTPTDGAVERAHAHLALGRLRQALLADHALAGAVDPEGAGCVLSHCIRHVWEWAMFISRARASRRL